MTRIRRGVFVVLTCAVLVVTGFGATSCGAAPAEPVDHRVAEASGRGEYLWYPEEHPRANPGQTAVDSYRRFTWRELEPRPGTYNFAELDANLAAAKERGGRFGFRVMAVCQFCAGATALPADLDQRASTWTAPIPDGRLRVPDWNDRRVQARWRQFNEVLGERYAGDPRLSYVDIGGYGNWGEGHNYPYEKAYPGPNGQVEGTVASIQEFGDAVIDNFPGHHTLLQTSIRVKDADGSLDLERTADVVLAGLERSPQVGLRNDCLGVVRNPGTSMYILDQLQEIAERRGVPAGYQPGQRWRQAPFVTEWCPTVSPGSEDTFTQGLDDVLRYHISGVSNASFQGEVASYPAEQRDALSQAGHRAGYRYSVGQPGDTAGGVSIAWTNLGTAPTYQKWTVSYLLTDASGALVAEVPSDLDLTALAEGDAVDMVPTTNWITAVGSRSGKYTLGVRVLDQTGYLSPMPLELSRRRTDGSYRLGTVQISASGTRQVSVSP